MIIQEMAAQGDVLFRRIDKLPPGLLETSRNGPLIVAHSETGHHHVIEDPVTRLFEKATREPMICYLMVDGSVGAGANVVHKRQFDTHATITLAPGCWEVRRQEEYTPAGWRRVED